MFHVPVLLEAVLANLVTKKGGIYLDGTAGGGGHSEAILKSLNRNGTLLVFDRDRAAIDETRNRLAKYSDRMILRQANFKQTLNILAELGIRKIDGALLDLGTSSHQIDTPDRGFSHSRRGDLDMRMNRTDAVTAREIVNSYSEQDLAALLTEYGEERRARALAKAIVRERKHGEIRTTFELRNIVESVIGERFLLKSLARVFQALRIAVNQELENLRLFLSDCMDFISPGGRIVILSYHSLEDRMVKVFFRKEATGCICPPEIPVCICHRSPKLRILTKRPVRPSKEEQETNPRSRSARLRAAEVLAKN